MRRTVREKFSMRSSISLALKRLRSSKSVRDNGIKIKNCVGIDTGTAYAVRAGIRNSNDLIWIGRAPSLAAKLSDCREYPYCVYMSEDAYRPMVAEAKMDGDRPMWESRPSRNTPDHVLRGSN